MKPIYHCLDCDRFFETPRQFTERHGLEAPPYETWLGCPNCGGAYEEAKLCDCCGNWTGGKYYETENGCVYCEECVTVVEN